LFNSVQFLKYSFVGVGSGCGTGSDVLVSFTGSVTGGTG